MSLCFSLREVSPQNTLSKMLRVAPALWIITTRLSFLWTMGQKDVKVERSVSEAVWTITFHVSVQVLNKL